MVAIRAIRAVPARAPVKVRLPGLSVGRVSLGGFTCACYAAEVGRFAGQIPDHRHVLSFGP
jgi:hypothetical protein